MLSNLLFLLLASPPPAAAFGPLAKPQQHLKLSALQSQTSSNLDSASTVRAALDATRQYGAGSSKARVLWDIVEEMRAADQHHREVAVTKGGLDQECLLDFDSDNDFDESSTTLRQDCLDYDAKMAELTELTRHHEDWRDLVQQEGKLDRFRGLTHDLRAIKLRVNTAAATLTTSPDSNNDDAPQVQAALSKAMRAAEEACLALEELNKALKENEQKAAGGSSGSTED